MTSKPRMGASRVLDVLGEKHFKSGAYEMLREVRNATGYRDEMRSADALVISCWPSRGVWFGGVEVKVSRSDWTRELDDPAKSHAIQRWCSYWWIATPAGIVKPGELPEKWGHIEVTESTARVVAIAPRLEAEPPSATFVASVFRNRADAERDRLSQARFAGFEDARTRFAGGEDLARVKAQLEVAQHSAQAGEKALTELRQTVHAFEQSTGVMLDSWKTDAADEFNRLRAAVRALEKCDLSTMAALLRRTADNITDAEQQLRAAQKVEAAE